MDSLKKSLIWFFIILLCGLPISFLAFGSDMQTQQNPLYPYRSSIFLQDEFASGTTASGQIGELGWNVSAGTTTFPASPFTNRIGILRRDTGAVSGTIATIQLYQGSSTFLFGSLNQSHTFETRLNNNDANTTVRYGVFNAIGANPPTEGIYLEKLDADTNWFCVTRAGAVQTRTDSTVAVNTSFNQFGFVRNSSGVTFTINNSPVCGTHTTNISAAGMNPGAQIINSAAAAKTFDFDYYQLIVTGFSR